VEQSKLERTKSEMHFCGVRNNEAAPTEGRGLERDARGTCNPNTTGAYAVSIVQNPTKSLAEDVEFTRRVIDPQDKPIILVGHSYGGVVVTEPEALG
jgi:pimeloyl-ACP methyl ester carboxylesterase